MAEPKILVIGALGQVGSELTRALASRYGATQVIAADVTQPTTKLATPFIHLDCTDRAALGQAITAHKITVIYHLAALLSATAEAHPQRAWQLNVEGLRTVLECSYEAGCRLFVPSSIAAFGPSTPHQDTPQLTIQRPSSLYGISKVTGELLCDYYLQRYGLDVRGVRYPGLISTVAPPGGGTTDYAVAMLRAAARGEPYHCPLASDTCLDMMYMPDAVRATLLLMDAERGALRFPNAYNVTAFSFSPAQLAEVIRHERPDFVVEYHPDARLQAIADSWPDSMDDSAARADWGWQPRYDLASMVREALQEL